MLLSAGAVPAFVGAGRKLPENKRGGGRAVELLCAVFVWAVNGSTTITVNKCCRGIHQGLPPRASAECFLKEHCLPADEPEWRWGVGGGEVQGFCKGKHVSLGRECSCSRPPPAWTTAAPSSSRASLRTRETPPQSYLLCSAKAEGGPRSASSSLRRTGVLRWSQPQSLNGGQKVNTISLRKISGFHNRLVHWRHNGSGTMPVFRSKNTPPELIV